jgi:D-tyrosyl-tRNA(Tyr) deacylase
MIALLQRVSSAQVRVGGAEVAAIGRGLVVLVGVERGDGDAELQRLAERLIGYRVFPDGEGRMNLDVRSVGGELLLVPQFTLAADTRRGNRPSFTPAASPAVGETRFLAFAEAVQARYRRVACGVFGADMQVCLCNEGPVTFWLQVAPQGGG